MEKLTRQALLQQEGKPMLPTGRPFPWKAVVLSSALILFSLLVATNLAITFQSQFQIADLQAELQSLRGRLLKTQKTTQFDMDEVEREFEEVDEFFSFQDMISASYGEENTETSDVRSRMKRGTKGKGKRKRTTTQGVFHLTGRLPDPSRNDGCQKMRRNGGNQLRLPPKLNVTVGNYDDYIIKCWEPATWVKTYSSTADYEFNKDSGRITVKNAGLYYIYSQLFYDNGFNYDQPYGHGIFLNKAQRPIFRCTVKIEATTYESCYTGGVEYLMAGDSMSVQNTVNNANLNVSMSEALSYWGIFKVQTVPTKKGGGRGPKPARPPRKNKGKSHRTP